MNIASPLPFGPSTTDPRASERADLVGKVIWHIVRNDGLRSDRSLFLLADLDPTHLVGLSRTFPSDGTYQLAIDPRIAPDLLSALPSAHLTDKSAVKIRNTDAMGAVLIAVRDSDRNDVGASLGHVPFLDRGTIQGATDAWIQALEPAFGGSLGVEKRAFLRSMIEGLTMSGVTKDLDQFARVLDDFVSDPALTFDERLRRTSKVLRLPYNCYGKMPNAEAKDVASASTFRAMFRDAERELRSIPYLLGPDQKRLDHKAIAGRVKELRERIALGEDGPSATALDAIEALLADRLHLKPGLWRPSQQAFCEAFDWKAHGKQVFEARSVRTTKTLAEMTRQFFEDEHASTITPDDDTFLKEFEANAASDERIEQFFERHRGTIVQDGKLHTAWRQKVYPDVVRDEPDLLSGLLRGVQTLLIKAADPSAATLPRDVRIVVGAKNADKVSTWKDMDRRTYELFRLEMRLLMGAFGDFLEVDLGKWLDSKAMGSARDTTSSDARMVELELRLRDASGTLSKDAVRVYWRPSAGKWRSMALSFPGDIERLYKGFGTDGLRLRSEVITPRGRGDDGAMSLHRAESFDDVGGGDTGRTTDPSKIGPGEEWFEVVESHLAQLNDSGRLSRGELEVLGHALTSFRASFTAAVKAIHETPEKCYATAVIPDVAESFGDLCEFARLALWRDADARRTALRQICEFGIPTSSTSVEAAIVPAWHPLRLLERRAKAQAVATMLRETVSRSGATVEGIERETAALLRVLDRWHLPEVISINLKPFACVEDVGGYGLAVPVERAISNTQALEASAKPARDQFMAVADEYLRLNPHEESNFATAIYNAESVELPRLVADALESRMEGRDHVRCGLLITHDDAARVRRTFALQNARLQGRSSGVDGGFLSRLRVGVRSSAGSLPPGHRPDIDLLFLHDVFFQQASVAWDYVSGAAAEQDPNFDIRAAMRPRRRFGACAGSGARRLDMAMVVDTPPRSLARFVDLCHAASQEARAIPPGERAVPRRQVSWEGSSSPVRRMIEHAHDIAEWVVSYDRLSSRAMLADAGIKVIRDVAIPGTDARVLVSSREPSVNLLRVIRRTYARMAQSSIASDAGRMADRTIATVVNASGQKVMAAGRSENAALEIIGLAASVALVQDAPEMGERKPVWFSLDDSRAVFGLKGELADTLALSIRGDEASGFSVLLTIVEAKCVNQMSASSEAQASLKQIRATCADLRSKLVDQSDVAARRGWGVDLLAFFSGKPEFAQAFANHSDRESFERALVSGKVNFELLGRSIVAVHDDEGAKATLETVEVHDQNLIVQYRFGQRVLADFILALDGDRPAPIVPPTRLKTGIDDEARPVSDAITESTSDQEVDDLDAGMHTISHEPDLTSGGSSFADTVCPSAGGNFEEPTTQDLPSTFSEGAATLPLLHRTFTPALARLLATIAERSGAPATEQELRDGLATARRLQAAFVDFGMRAEMSDPPITTTPNGVIARFRGNSTLTVKKIEAKRSELRTTHGLNVIRIMEGLGEIGVFVAAQRRRVVDLARTLLDATWPTSAPLSLTSFLVGLREDNGAPLWLNLDEPFGGNEAHAPHTLIAGETGSGKGVLTQNLLLQMVALNDPRNLRLHLIDPKFGVDYFWISDAPHLQGGIVATQDEAERCLDGLVAEMERRYELLVANRVPNIREYNARVAEDERLARVVIIHDEMADWMAGSPEYREMIQRTMTRLAAKARACGIHVVMITQRAAQDAIPVGIRDNLGNRLVLKVASEAGSMLALKVSGAERLLGKGHVAANLSGDRPSNADYFVAQTPFASTDDLTQLGQAAIEAWKAYSRLSG